MDIGKPITIAGLGFLIWGVYSLVIIVFRGFFRDCFRTARELPGRSFLNGAVALGISLLAVFGAVFLLGGNRALFAGGLFAAFQMAGSAVGLVIIGSLGGVIDVEKRPCSALAAGIIISWLVRVFSTDAAEIFNLAIAIYGVGAVTLYFRGEAPAAPGAEVQPELDMPAGDGELARRFREKQTVPQGAKAGGGVDLLWVLIAVVVIGAMFYAYKNNPAIRNIISPGEAAGPVEPLTSEERDRLDGADNGSGAASEKRSGDLVSGAAENEAVAENPMFVQATGMLAPVMDLSARMWAYRIQQGEFTAEELEGNMTAWIATDNYKKLLLIRIQKLLAAGPVTPLTRSEKAKIDAVTLKVRDMLQSKQRAGVRS